QTVDQHPVINAPQIPQMQLSVQCQGLILPGENDSPLGRQFAPANLQKFRPWFEYSRQGVGGQEVETVNRPVQLHRLIWPVLKPVFNRQAGLCLGLPLNTQPALAILQPSLSLPGLWIKLLLNQTAGDQI